MKWLKRNNEIILGLVFLVALIWLLYYLLTAGLRVLNSLTETNKVALLVAFLTVFGSLASLIYTRIKDRQLQLEAVHTSKKQEIYTKFVRDIFTIIGDPSRANDEDFVHKMRIDFMSEAFLWSNEDVIKSYHNFRRHAQQTDNEYLLQYDIATMMLAFRKDLGLKNKNISEQTMLEIMYDQNQLESYILNNHDEDAMEED